MFERILKKELKSRLFQGKTILLIGPRQVGKTTLINQILSEDDTSSMFLDGDDPSVRQLLNTPNTEQIRQIIGTTKLIFIDEAQRIKNIGITAKIITDQFKDRQLILSGSSSFELGNSIQEPLTGRKWTYHLYPISWQEWQNDVGFLKAEQSLEKRLINGFYPDLLNHPDDEQDILLELVNSYLYQDVLAFAGLRKPDVLQKLVQALAYQVGQEVAYKELGDTIGLDPKTVSHYIDILEKSFVVFRLPAFSKNLRNEIKNNRKIYFYDNGVRNAVIGAFQPLPGRMDIGALWENFLLSERLKSLRYGKKQTQMYFWRTKQQQEIDYVETSFDSIKGFEFKWNPQRKIKFPKTFTNTYNATVEGITRENFREFVMES